MNIRARISKKVLLLLAGDILLLYASLWAGLWLRYAPGEIPFNQHALPFTVIFLVWLIGLGAAGLYELRLMKNGKLFLYRLLGVMGVNIVAAITILYLLPFEIEPRRNLFLIAGGATLFLFAWRYVFNLAIIRAPSTKVIFLGINRETVDLADYLLAHPQLGHKPVGFVTNGEPLPVLFPPLPNFSLSDRGFRHIVFDTRAEIIVIAREMKGNPTVVKALFEAIPLGISVAEFPAFHEMLTGKVPLSFIEEVWFLENLIGIKKRTYDFLKRTADFFLAIALGAATLALLPFIAAGIALSTPRDIIRYRELRARKGDGILFFRQRRVGKNGKQFDFIKFRSYRLGAEKMGEAKSLQSDPRQYPFGRLLRACYLDEFPQCLNVLAGEMSFVGPRPERPEYVAELKKHTPFYEMRLLVLPGITGWAQVNMEDDASVEDAPEKMQYDLYYIKNRSLILDLLILLKTGAAVVGRRGR